MLGRHEGHRAIVVPYPCGCSSIVCEDCDITDGVISPECDPGKLGYVHPRLTWPSATPTK